MWSAFMASFFPVPIGGSCHILELRECGVQSRFHRTDGNLEDVGDLAVFQILVIRKNQGLSEGVREAFDAVAVPIAAAPAPAVPRAARCPR